MPEDQLPLTGERTVPGIAAENYWFRRHEVAYEFAQRFTRGATVLEVGSGEGYGTNLLAGSARRILGIDYDQQAVAHARVKYPRADFVRANLAKLPVRSGSIDTVVSLQVIEHVWDHPQFVRECRRVLVPAGTLLVTTPNRLTFSPGLDAPTNPFHTKEFTATELCGLITACGFEVGDVVGIHNGPRLAALDGKYGGFVDAQLHSHSWDEELLADVGSVTTADFAVVGRGARDIDESLDLVVVATRTD